MHQVILAGGYPTGTEEKLMAALPKDAFCVRSVNTAEEYAALSDAEYLVLRVFKAEQADMERNKNLKMILRWGVGTDSVDLSAAAKRGITVTNTPGANAGAVAELALLLMLACERKLPLHMQAMQLQKWSRNTYQNESFRLNKKVLGVIGGGNIGRRVASLAQAFGAETIYYDMFRLSESMEQALHLTYLPLVELLRISDIVSLHIPLTEQTKNFLSAAEFAQMKQGAILINTARGELLDDDALVAAIRANHIAAAGLDAFRADPLPFDHPFYAESRILMTPHIGGGTADLADDMIPMIAEDLLLHAAGKQPKHVVAVP